MSCRYTHRQQSHMLRRLSADTTYAHVRLHTHSSHCHVHSYACLWLYIDIITVTDTEDSGSWYHGADTPLIITVCSPLAHCMQIGIIGHCWGAQQMMFAAASPALCNAGVGPHPSRLTPELAEAVQCPIALFPTHDDPDHTPIKETLDKKPFAERCVYHRYGKNTHTHIETDLECTVRVSASRPRIRMLTRSYALSFSIPVSHAFTGLGARERNLVYVCVCVCVRECESERLERGQRYCQIESITSYLAVTPMHMLLILTDTESSRDRGRVSLFFFTQLPACPLTSERKVSTHPGRGIACTCCLLALAPHTPTYA